MFDKIEFSNFYKFLTSIGLVLIVSALLLPWLILKNEYNINISDNDLSNLTLEAQELYSDKTNLLHYVFKLLPIVAIIFFVCGIFIFIYGIMYWYKRQSIIDQTENLALIKLRSEIQPLTSSQIKE